MKEIKAIIQPFLLEKVLDALRGVEDLPGVTISRVLGWGKSRAANARDPVEQSGHALAKKTKLEIVVRDELAHRVEEAIGLAAQTGRPGDGKIFVYDVQPCPEGPDWGDWRGSGVKQRRRTCNERE